MKERLEAELDLAAAVGLVRVDETLHDPNEQVCNATLRESTYAWTGEALSRC